MGGYSYNTAGAVVVATAVAASTSFATFATCVTAVAIKSGVGGYSYNTADAVVAVAVVQLRYGTSIIATSTALSIIGSISRVRIEQ